MVGYILIGTGSVNAKITRVEDTERPVANGKLELSCTFLNL